MPTQTPARRYERVDIKPAKWVTVQGSGRREVYPCTKMGLGGLFLRGSNPFPEGAMVRFGFYLSFDTIRGVASVRHVSARGMGLAFRSFLNTADRAKIRGFVKQLEGKRG